MKIVRADPEARVMTESELLSLLAEPVNLHLGLRDGDWPVVLPLWFVYDQGKILVSSGAASRKIRLAHQAPHAYFCIDVGTGAKDVPRGVRGRCDVRVIADDVAAAVALMEKSLTKYMGSLNGDMQRGFLQSARNNETAVIELTPHAYATWTYSRNE